ncbi:hypothetical protein LUZ63_017633 [Rhynchospora breviuscula]|uniref:E2F/DP family winged-helix DNA-binding domain-containing protein n=1 Tax=Rhynchospora breviuscula TaxID=2022672 RepID=A0A9Q0C2T7_9POAL|nr:hypothetical protein LUZ63_017633 [Rhynchospora breviuscula]
MVDDPSEHDRTVVVNASVCRSSPFSAAQPKFSPPGEYHHSRAVVNKTPRKRKKATMDKRSSESGNGESPRNSARTPTTCRFDSSLVRLTEKFLELFNKAPGSSLDLNEAAETLKISKRRLYDITNVLEGIGLAEKKRKNAICWNRNAQEEANSEMDDSVATLKASFEDFKSKEHKLDEQISEMQGRIKKFIEDEKRSLFLTENELKALPCFKNQTLIVVTAPQGTTLEVPDPCQGGARAQRRYRFIVRSNAGPIQVYLVSKVEEHLSSAAENLLACLDANERSEIVPSSNTNSEDIDYWISSDPGLSISDTWDLSPEVQWDHISSEEVPTVPQGRDENSSSALNAPLKP